MQHLLEIYNHLAQTKSQRFTDKRKAEMLPNEIKNAWDQRKDILTEADPEEIVQLVLSTHTHAPLLMSMVKKLKHQSCIHVVNALISLLDMGNIRQVLRYCKTIAPPPEDSDDEDSDDEDSDGEDYDPPLVTAIMKKDIPIEMIEMLLQEGCDPNSMIANKGPVSDKIYATNNSSLYCALHQNRRDIVKLLLDKGATVTNDHYNSDFHDSGSADIIDCIDDYAMVKLLLDHGADPNSSYYQSEDAELIPDNVGTALILAIFTGNKRVVQLLLERGADIEHIQESNDYSGDALDFAYSVACGNADTWNEDVKANYLDQQVFYNDCKRTPNRVAILKLVLAAAMTNSRQTVLLRDAMLRPGCKEFAQLFLDKGVDVNFTEAIHDEFDTPFLCILMKYEGYRGTTTRADFLEFCYLNDIFDINSESIKELISGPTIDNAAIYEYMDRINTNWSKKKSIVKTSLRFSDVFEETLPQLQRIIRQTTDINACGNSEGHVSPLHCAIEHRSVEVVAMLLADERINVNVLDEDGESPLFYACYNTNTSRSRAQDADLTKIDMLLDAGCSVNARNLEGCTALGKMCWWIKEIKDHTVEIKACEKLLKAGADPNKADNDGSTPVSVVKNSELAILLLNYGGRIQDAPDEYQVEYREYRTQLNNENRTVDQFNLPDLVRLATQRLNGIHCERCHKLIVGDSRKDGDGQVCMECYHKRSSTQKAEKTKGTNPLYTQWVSNNSFQ
tara:strand:+ start:1029 stop:3224 length:2196 start_codon:yes stop_codon:yes gene_type:complete